MVSAKTCAVVGNGPSVTPGLLEAIGCPSFGLNAVASIYPKTTWRPTHYLLGWSQGDGGLSALPLVLESVALGIPSYIPHHWGERVTGPNVFLYGMHKGPEWATHTTSLFGGHTSVYLAAQMATVLGFRHILFMGLDGLRPRHGKDLNHLTDNYYEYDEDLSAKDAALANAGMFAGYIQMVGLMKDRGVTCDFVVPPKRIGLEF